MAKEMLPLPEELETIDVGQRVEIAVREAETRLGMLQRVMQVALKRTLPQDWVDFHGNPYLTAGGAERLRGLFAITVDNTEVKRYEDKDDRGGYFWFVVSAIAHFRDDALAVMGTCSARDQFFSTRHEGNEKILLPADQVDPTNLLKAAYSNMLTNAVTRILGIRNLTWGQLEAIGFKRGEAARVEFKGGKAAEKPAPEKPAPTAAPKAAQGAPPDGKAWYSSLIAEFSKYVQTNEESQALLKRITAFKSERGEFPGFASWGQLQQHKNAERAAEVAYAKLQRLVEAGEIKPVEREPAEA